MKNTIITFVFLCFITSFSIAEDFFVLHTKGTIMMNNNPLKKGDKLTAQSEITFQGADAVAVVMSTKRGRLILKNQNTASDNSEFSYIVSNIFSPSSGKLSTRAGEILNFIDLSAYVKHENYIVIDSSVIPLGVNGISVDEKHFFFVRYRYKGETINKKLETKNGNVSITSSLYSVDGISVGFEDVSDGMLFYYDAEEQTTKEVGAFMPVFIDSKEVEETRNLIKQISSKKDDVSSEVRAFIKDAYGFIPKKDFDRWYSSTVK